MLPVSRIRPQKSPLEMISSTSRRCQLVGTIDKNPPASEPGTTNRRSFNVNDSRYNQMGLTTVKVGTAGFKTCTHFGIGQSIFSIFGPLLGNDNLTCILASAPSVPRHISPHNHKPEDVRGRLSSIAVEVPTIHLHKVDRHSLRQNGYSII